MRDPMARRLLFGIPLKNLGFLSKGMFLILAAEMRGSLRGDVAVVVLACSICSASNLGGWTKHKQGQTKRAEKTLYSENFC